MANDGISLSVAPGQVHALLGENGAGKTTLMNVLYGLIQPDEGEILIDGKQARFHSPKDAIAAGIGMVHQHFMLVPVFTVAENVTLGIEQADRVGLLDRRRTRREVADLSHQVRARRGPGRAGGGPAGRHPAAGGDRQGAGAPGERADPRRAHGGADPGGDRGAVPHRAPAAGRRHVGHLHLAQAQRGPGDRRHDHRAAPRRGGRRAARRPRQPKTSRRSWSAGTYSCESARRRRTQAARSSTWTGSPWPATTAGSG